MQHAFRDDPKKGRLVLPDPEWLIKLEEYSFKDEFYSGVLTYYLRSHHLTERQFHTVDQQFKEKHNGVKTSDSPKRLSQLRN